MAIQASDLGDLIKSTLNDLGRLKFAQEAANLQRYTVFSQLFKKERVEFQDGVGIKWNIMLDYDEDAASWVGLTDEDSATITNVLSTLTVPWRHVTTNWSVEFVGDVLMNRGASQILNVLAPRRASALISMAAKVESAFWGDAPGTSDTLLPYGAAYWVVQNATTGFNGGAPGSHTSVGGISPTSKTNWKNYTAQYTTVNKDDLIALMRKAYRNCNFESPVTTKDFRDASFSQRIYVPETVLTTFETVGEGQNENLGRDLDSMGGQILFRKSPVVWVSKLDESSVNPVYMLDHGVFKVICLKGNYLRESDAVQNGIQHNLYTIHVDTSMNFLTSSRRANAVIATA